MEITKEGLQAKGTCVCVCVCVCERERERERARERRPLFTRWLLNLDSTLKEIEGGR